MVVDWLGSNAKRKGSKMKKEALSDAVKNHIDSIEALHLELNTQLNVNENLRTQLAEAMTEGKIKDGEITLLTRTLEVERLGRRHFERLSDQLMTQLSTLRTLIDDVFLKVGQGMRKKDMEVEQINGQDAPAPSFLLKGPSDDHTS